MQGFNMGRYYPPDPSAAPTFNQQSHPLGSRAKKVNQGILTVRFELPFAVWCTHCTPEAIVGQGVRFNAEKKKVGNYYSTPIWSFKMKHTACGGSWEIRTDPKNAAYTVVEGARKRDYGDEDVKKDEYGEEEMESLMPEGRKHGRRDAMAAMEKGIESRAVEKVAKSRIQELLEKNEVDRDPYTMNQKMRREFRAGRKLREKEDRVKEGLQDKFSFGYDIAEEKEADRLKASLVEFGAKNASDETLKRGMFEKPREDKAEEMVRKPGMLKSEFLKQKTRKDLERTLFTNTRAAIDPFLENADVDENGELQFSFLKRKRSVKPKLFVKKTTSTVEQHAPASLNVASTTGQQSLMEQRPAKRVKSSVDLVAYEDSD